MSVGYLRILCLFALLLCINLPAAQDAAPAAEEVPLPPDQTLDQSEAAHQKPATSNDMFEEPDVVGAGEDQAEGETTEQKPAEAEALETGDGEKPAEAQKTEADKPAAGEKTAEGEKAAEGEQAQEADVIPPAPEPTAEQRAAREVRSRRYQSLAEKTLNFPVSGTLYTRYRARFDSREESDNEIYSYLTIDAGDKERHLATGHADMRFAADFEDRKRGLNSDVFSGLLDTYNENLNFKLYSAYVDFGKICGLENLRVGRQFTYDTPEVAQFDGLRLDTKPILDQHEVQFSLYGGASVHLDETSREGDFVGGFAAQGKPWSTARLRLDYMHATDDLGDWQYTGPNPNKQSLNTVDGVRHDNLVALSMWQTFHCPDISLFGRIETLDADVRELLTRVVYHKPDWQLQMALTYRANFDRQFNLPTEFDPYTRTLQGYEPYHNLNFVFTKYWNDHFRVEGGALMRRLMDNADEGAFNHSFERYYLTGTVYDLPVEGFSAGVTGYLYEGHDDRVKTIGTLGGEVSYKWTQKLISTVGTDFELYKYDFFQNSERNNVRTYYVKQRWRPERWAVLDVEYDYEQSLGREFHTFEATFRFNF